MSDERDRDVARVAEALARATVSRPMTQEAIADYLAAYFADVPWLCDELKAAWKREAAYFEIAHGMVLELHTAGKHPPEQPLCRIGFCDRWTPEKRAAALESEPAP